MRVNVNFKLSHYDIAVARLTSEGRFARIRLFQFSFSVHAHDEYPPGNRRGLLTYFAASIGSSKNAVTVDANTGDALIL